MLVLAGVVVFRGAVIKELPPSSEHGLVPKIAMTKNYN